MPTRTQLITIGMTLAIIATINNVDALDPVKDILKG